MRGLFRWVVVCGFIWGVRGFRWGVFVEEGGVQVGRGLFRWGEVFRWGSVGEGSKGANVEGAELNGIFCHLSLGFEMH